MQDGRTGIATERDLKAKVHLLLPFTDMMSYVCRNVENSKGVHNLSSTTNGRNNCFLTNLSFFLWLVS